MNIPNGIYSFEFSGVSEKHTLSFHLTGIGVISIQNGILTGRQSSSIVGLQNNGEYVSKIGNKEFDLVGEISDHDFQYMSKATIRFTEILTGNQILDGTFTLAKSGNDEYWIISTGATRVDRPEIEPNEVVSGRVVKIA